MLVDPVVGGSAQSTHLITRADVFMVTLQKSPLHCSQVSRSSADVVREPVKLHLID